MDEGQMTPIAPTVEQTSPPVTGINTSAVEEPKKGGISGLLIALLVIALLLTIVAVGAYYWYANQTNVGQKASFTQLTPTPTPPETLDSLESEVTNLQIEDIDKDFIDIDNDLGNL